MHTLSLCYKHFFLPSVNYPQYKPAQKKLVVLSRGNKTFGKGRQRIISTDSKLIKEATQPPSSPHPKNTLREQTGKPRHQPPGYQSCHIWTKLGEQEGIENSITLFISPSDANPLPSSPNHFNMFLFTLLLPKWSDPACHLTQSFVLTEAFFSCRKALAGRGDKELWCGEGKEKNAVYGDCIFDNISSS